MIISSIRHLAFILKCRTSETELNEIASQLSDKNFSFDSIYYRERKEVTTLKNGKLKTRILNPSGGRLKLIQTRIKKNILDNIQFPPYIQGGLKGCSNLTNACLHLGNKYKFTTDIKRFFPSIRPSQVYSSFSRLGYKPEISRILTILVTYKGRLPQGTPTSAHIANLVFLETDEKIYSFCQSKGITYSRYIDDVTLSAPFNFQNEICHIIDFIKSVGFKISARKTHFGHIVDVTGIKTGNNTLKPNDKFFQRLNESLSESSKEARNKYLQRVKAASKKKLAKTNKKGNQISPLLSPEKMKPFLGKGYRKLK